MVGGNVMQFERLRTYSEGLFSAEEYLRQHEPGLLDLFLDREQALKEELGKAREIALKLGIKPAFQDGIERYPEGVWKIVS